MMTKASFLMNEHLKHNVPLVQHVHPTLLIARGRLAFPQGLELIAEVFRGKSPADMYAHRYFIEKQTDPTQPSPQYHLTEEYQGMLKVMKGLRYMSDKTSKLDTTMMSVLDPESGDVFLYNPINLDDASMLHLLTELGSWGVKEAADAAKVIGARQRNAPMQRHNPKNIQNEGSELNLSAEATLRSDTEDSVPSAFSRYRDARTTGSSTPSTLSPKAPKLARVAGIILPTRQSLWDPLKLWANYFPEAQILSSLDAPPSDDHLGKWFETTEIADFKKRFQPISTILAADATHSNNIVDVRPGLRLIRVLGDAKTDEYVMHHEDSQSLSCTDLFHGSYSDFDPVNTWLCRVFFKLMKEGNYKRVDIPPQYKWDAVAKHGDLKQFRATVEQLCHRFDWTSLLYAHGTSPLIEAPKESLQLQWGTREASADERKKMMDDATTGNEELHGSDTAKQRPEEDFLLRRRRF